MPLQRPWRSPAGMSDMDMKNIEDFYPLTALQQGILFECLMAPGSGLYCQQAVASIEGDLNVAALIRSWKGVANRNPALRTSFIWEGVKEPLQVVHREVPVDLEQEDWRHLTPSEQQSRLAAYQSNPQNRQFDLTKPPLSRTFLVRMSDNVYQMISSSHHLLGDAWSAALLWEELFAFYKAFSNGLEPQLKSRRPFKEYVKWQRQQDFSEPERFWRNYLAGISPSNRIGIEHPNGSQPSAGDARGDQQTQLSVASTNALQTFARQHRLTLNTLIQGALGTILSRYSNEDDVAFGTNVSGRNVNLAQADSMIGLLTNTLPVRLRFSDDALLLPWLAHLQKQAFEIRDFEYTPLGFIQRWAGVPQGRSLFITLLVFENYPREAYSQAPDEHIKVKFYQSIFSTHYPLFTFVFPDRQLAIRIMYNRTQFDDAAVTRMLGHFRTLLEGMVAKPGRRVLDLPMLTLEERHQLLVEWNETAHEYAKDKCIHRLIEVQAASTPDAVAVTYEERGMTYQELNARANQLAHCLRERGVGPDVLVGLCVERSVEMMVGLLGILKAGGGYVPLDPEFPRERLAFMLEDSAAPVLVTQQHLLERLPESRATVICLDRDAEKIAHGSQENPKTQTSPENLAYVIYTSGSTGKPKGVQIPHRAVVNFLNSMKSKPGIDASDVLVAVTTLSFDIAGLELYLPLTVGARVVIAGREVASDGVRLAQLLADSQATVMQATPATWKLLLAAGWKGDRRLKMLCGGEALPMELARELVEKGGALWNMYGPTETTIWSTLARVGGREEKITIGRPIDNTLVYILDPHGHPVPIGVPGELHLGGDGLARGYLNRPELTTEKFIPDPFCATPGSRIYKTGDLARWRADGTIECLGRMDHQVKLRGFRIELGEIETVLREQPDVKDAVVVAREDTPGENRLAAYVIPETGRDLNVSELRRQLKLKLPDYMIPAAFVLRDDFPLTPNSKVDRRALPPPEQTRAELEATYVAPTTETECTIASIWQEVLHLQRIGIHDNFFDVGGHSLLALQVMSRVHEKLGVEVPLRTIFQTATVAGLAETVLQLKSQQEKREQEEVLKRIEVLDEAEVDAELSKRAHAIRGTDTE
jgi:amino acid adenylation domain-containing protein